VGDSPICRHIRYVIAHSGAHNISEVLRQIPLRSPIDHVQGALDSHFGKHVNERIGVLWSSYCHVSRAGRRLQMNCNPPSRLCAVRQAGHLLSCILMAHWLGGCASLPPGHGYPKTYSTALSEPEATRIGHQFSLAAKEHGGQAGYRIISVGVDGFLMRMEMINAAERSLDLQYYRYRGGRSADLLDRKPGER
jgi:hypothetical protein